MAEAELKNKIGSESEELSGKICQLFDGYSLAQIGLALGITAGVFVAKAELENDNGEKTIDLLGRSIRAFGDLNIAKIQLLKSKPEELKKFMKECSYTEH